MLIGIVGQKFNGKSEVSKHLTQKHKFIEYAFADPLKRGVQEMFGFTNDQMWGDKKDEVDLNWGIKPREIIQIMGTELLQFEIHKYTDKLNHIGRKLWVNRFRLWYYDQRRNFEQRKMKWSQSVYDLSFNKNVQIKETKLPEPKFNIVVSDIRFQHEIDVIKDLGGVIWKIERPDVLSDDNHISENELINFNEYDLKIINDGTVKQLKEKIDSYINQN